MCLDVVCTHNYPGHTHSHKIVDLWLNDKLKWFDLRKWNKWVEEKWAKKR